MTQQIVHYSLHFLAVGLIAYFYDRKNWKKYWLILIATMLVDLDHLLATPFFDPERCSIGFHPLHSELAITIYVLGMIFAKNKVLRLVFIGLFFHMLTDLLDCLWTYARCAPCMQDIF
ncbi:DUF6122 family protein [Christiangramia flava]|uniref:Uncharacterized protein n=1 Tax=Christiangramia flava JLT2011 TaxID=1229726 RepID=A0A1L7I6S2_9FLAO|nr:DUF6122 family protein [Christiangramia flava]APU68815.1 hypothetical protein GRFL_2091 [Christiangramia flava JLT2011]OSS39040.1 hypothetical protein C723_2046 [Christiangramia flava JLT2011]